MSVKVMLDAGHFGPNYNPGATPGYYESVFNWDFHLMLKSELEEYGFEVSTTRTNRDIDLEETERGERAEGYDLFISVHSNGDSNNANVNKVVVIYPYDGMNNTYALAHSLSTSIETAMGVNGHMEHHGTNENGEEQYRIMRGARASGCPRFFIVEHSYHTNAYASNWLMSNSNLQRMAKIEAYVIARYFNLCLKKGDFDNDGARTTTDYSILRNYFTGGSLNSAQLKAADLTFDGVVSSADLLALQADINGSHPFPFDT